MLIGSIGTAAKTVQVHIKQYKMKMTVFIVGLT